MCVVCDSSVSGGRWMDNYIDRLLLVINNINKINNNNNNIQLLLVELHIYY